MCTVPLTVLTSQILEECHLAGKATYTTLMKPLKKSYLLIGLAKFVQELPFAVSYSYIGFKSHPSAIHPICMNAWESFSDPVLNSIVRTGLYMPIGLMQLYVFSLCKM